MKLGLVITTILSVTVLLGAVPVSNFAFADVGQKKVWSGDGPPPSMLGDSGDLYIDSSGTHLVFYHKISKSTWQNLGAFQGSQGPKGDTGPAGSQGPKGDTGPAGS